MLVLQWKFKTLGTTRGHAHCKCKGLYGRGATGKALPQNIHIEIYMYTAELK